MSILTVNHNIASLNTQRNLEVNSFNLAKSLQKLSSGFRINVAADGPADLVISEGLRVQISGLNAALRNTQEASNYLGIAEGALGEITSLLDTMRSLAVHAANTGVVTTSQIAADQAEVDRALASINRINAATRFAGSKVFVTGNKTFHIGEGATALTDEVKISVGTVSVGTLGIGTISGTNVGGRLSLHANSVIAKIDLAVTRVTSLRGKLGAMIKDTLQTNVNSLSVALENVTATESYVRDANMARETSEYTKNQILVQAGVSVLAQANVASQSVLQLLG